MKCIFVGWLVGWLLFFKAEKVVLVLFLGGLGLEVVGLDVRYSKMQSAFSLTRALLIDVRWRGFGRLDREASKISSRHV